MQILFIPIALIVLIINIWGNKKWLIGITIFILGLILGNLPMLLFDIRHNFYELNTLFQYLVDTFRGKSDAGVVYYYFLPFWPIFAIVGGIIITKVFKWNKIVSLLIIVIYLYLNFVSQRVSFSSPTGMPSGIKISDINEASKIIADDVKGDFNVAEVLDFDKRAYVLRYFTEFKYGKKPLGETEYPNLKLLYVLSRKGYNFDESGVWEIYSGGKYKINLLSEVGNGYAVYKLSK